MSHLPCCRYALNNNLVELVTFLDIIQTINQREIAKKASEIIIKSYFKDLKPKVQNLSSFKYPDKLASSGFLVHSFCTHEEYANKLLTPNVLPASMAVRTPLLFPLNLVSRRDLVLAFAEELKQCFSLPRLTTHTGTLQVSSVEVVILSQYTLASLTATSKRRCLQDGECTVLLAAVQVNLTYLSITASAARLNPLNPKFFSLQTTFSPHMPFTHLISISVQALTPKLNPCPLPALISSLVTLTTPTH